MKYKYKAPDGSLMYDEINLGKITTSNLNTLIYLILSIILLLILLISISIIAFIIFRKRKSKKKNHPTLI